MRKSSVFVVVPFCFLQIQFAYANCSEIGKQAVASRSALIVAKDNYKREAMLIQSKPLSAETIAMSITSNRNVKRAMDDTIEILSPAMTAGCFGRDADAWRRAIVQLREESEEVGKSIQMLLQIQAGGAKRAN